MRVLKNYDLIIYWEREFVFYGVGYYLYSIFWFLMYLNGKRCFIGVLF